MKSDVVRALSEFLGAFTYQVEAWDRKVIDGLVNNAHLFSVFQSGCDHTKWNIYTAVKFANRNAPV